MLRKIFFYAFLVVQCPWMAGQETGARADTVSLIFIGDIMGHDSQIRAARNNETGEYDYNEVFSYIREEISDADIAVANLEVTLAGPPYTGYPRFSSPAALASACLNAGINCLVTANNHSADRETEGIISTIQKLDSIGVLHTGTFISKAARNTLHPLMIKEKGLTIALLNYTYGTNGIRVREPAIVNMLDIDLIIRDIKIAKSKNPDLVILFLHWGTEYESVPSRTQTDLADHFFSEGADLIIGSHPHVLQKMEWSKPDSSGKERFLVYSLGNFVSNQRKIRTDGGAMVRLTVIKQDGSWKISEAGYFLTWVYTPDDANGRKFFILPGSKYEKMPEFFNNPADFDQMKAFLKDSRTLLYNQNINVPEYVFRDDAWELYW
ncbi:MAG: CapA family protein [Bacteroidales bacterium]|nr:CapA family protein [Bacteroidales bacterium]